MPLSHAAMLGRVHYMRTVVGADDHVPCRTAMRAASQVSSCHEGRDARVNPAAMFTCVCVCVCVWLAWFCGSPVLLVKLTLDLRGRPLASAQGVGTGFGARLAAHI